MTDALTKLSNANTMLAEANTVLDALEVRDIATAARAYAKAAQLGIEATNKAAEIKIRAERRAGEMLAQLERGQGNRYTVEGNSALPSRSEYAAALDETNTNKMQASRWQQIATIPEPVFEQHIAETVAERQELTTAGVMRLKQKIEREDRASGKNQPPPLVGTYNVIYADPPWSYSNSGFDQSAADQYPTMSTADICDLPVRELAGTPCVLYLWATSPLLPDALQVMEAWGFEYKAMRIWDKVQAPGMGWWVRTQHEMLLIGTANGNAHPTERLPSVVREQRTVHSRKPAQFRTDIESVHPGPYIELFAREAAAGWTAWGNEDVNS
jgi:N6-adenosine-specific RNA methylase IME4